MVNAASIGSAEADSIPSGNASKAPKAAVAVPMDATKAPESVDKPVPANEAVVAASERANSGNKFTVNLFLLTVINCQSIFATSTIRRCSEGYSRCSRECFQGAEAFKRNQEVNNPTSQKTSSRSNSNGKRGHRNGKGGNGKRRC